MGSIGNILHLIPDLNSMGFFLKSGSQFTLFGQALKNAFNRIYMGKNADRLRITANIVNDTGWPQLEDQLVILGIAWNGAVVIALGQNPFHIGSGAVGVKNCQNVDIAGCCQLHPRKKCQRSEFKQLAGTHILKHFNQLIF